MLKTKIKTFIKRIPYHVKEYVRILKISRKPNKEEFMKVAKITAVGMLIVGVIGFLIQSINMLVTGFV